MKRAYVTGATGCVGRNLVDVLIEKEWEVVALHRRTSDTSRLHGSGARLQEVDLYDLASIRKALPEHANALFHVAANVSHCSAHSAAQWKDNVLATRNLVQVSLERKVERFIFTSTGATRFYQETDREAAQRINIPYVRTKRLAELEVYDGLERGLDAVVLHPIIVVGAYDYNNYSQIFDNLKHARLKISFPGRISFCHARDVALAHFNAYETGRRGERYMLGGTHTTWRAFFQMVADKVAPNSKVFAAPAWLMHTMAYASNLLMPLAGKEPQLTPELVRLVRDEPDLSVYDKNKARTELGYHSRSLEEMVEDCYRWLSIEHGTKPHDAMPQCQPRPT